LPAMRRPTMRPKSPRTEPKISMTRILTNRAESAASATAAVDPVIPTQIAQTDSQTGPEEREAGVHVRLGVHVFHARQLGRKDNGHNQTVDGHHLTENNGDEVFGCDSWRLDAGSDDCTSGDENSPELVCLQRCVQLYSKHMNKSLERSHWKEVAGRKSLNRVSSQVICVSSSISLPFLRRSMV
jgi:hypothetical protein